MVVSPEAQILILVGLILAVAYLGIFPTLREKTINRLMQIDLGLNALALIVAGAWFWGTGVQFTLLFFEVNWVVFTIVCYAIIEIPLFLHFAKAHGIRLDGRDDNDTE
ncbi:hypothetical protein [Loktanella sp. Alg231-35]|uniref:hypothetical protein n=1 Tax=Loktanella sp. Alg231-35 TaxID=1922220 RepID=UPI000D560429|nr:hypothetical protein [Loktanella sp. Alg231-35]